MSTESATIVQRLWNYCNVLRDDGVSYGDYVEQLTYLLFLKMADEREREFGKQSAIPPEYSWASLRGLEGDELETPLPHHPHRAGPGFRPDPRHLSQGAEPHPGPGQAAPADQPDRRRDLGGAGH